MALIKRRIAVGGLLLLVLLVFIGSKHGSTTEHTSTSMSPPTPTIVVEPPTVTTELSTPTIVQSESLPTVTTPTYEIVIDESDATALAQTAWGEARGCSTMGIAAVMWCVLNRVDSTGYGMGNSVEYVVSFPNQFLGYSPSFPVEDRLYDLAVDVLTRWQKEKQGASIEEVGRVLPQEYLYFHGDGEHNWFRNTYKHTGEYWDWSFPNPYVEVE